MVESIKESYQISPERYGTVNDYMEITVQYSMLALFGTMYPLAFLISFVWNLLELQTDKLKLLRYMQRPIPMNERTIGVWNGVLEMLAYMQLLSNTGMLSFLIYRINQEFERQILAFFISFLLLNFFLRYLENNIFGEVD